MKFGTFPIEEAAGALLAHTVRAARVLKKGHVLTLADVAMLKASGIDKVVAVRLEAEDVSEDAAAARIAAGLSGEHIRMSPARTGRCNLHAAEAGVVRIDRSAIDAANSVDETVTIATVPDLTAVTAGQMIATVKIIPFAVRKDVLASVEKALQPGAQRLLPFHAKKFALVSTLLPGLKPSVVASTEDVVARRVAEVGGALLSTTRTAHAEGDVAREIKAAVGAGADAVLIVGASATSDRQDVAPAAVVGAGGVVEHFGMPVDPGNLLVLARVGAVPVLVMPGCTRSPKLNGADWVLQRLAADIPVSRRDIMAMGVGGLLVDTPGRPLPRAQAVEKPDLDVDARPSPRVAAVVLAAGQSSRMGGRNKLLMDVEGAALVRRTAAAVLSAGVSDVIVVTGHEPEKVRATLEGLEVRFVHNPRYAEGLSTSLLVGIDAVQPDASGAVVCLGDMPGIAAAHIDRLIAGFDPDAGREIGVPTHRGKRGNPVLWGRRFFQEMHEISGDVGARHLIGANESLVYEVEFDDTGVLMDLDTPRQWEDFLAASSSPRSR